MRYQRSRSISSYKDVHVPKHDETIVAGSFASAVKDADKSACYEFLCGLLIYELFLFIDKRAFHV